ncbi:calcium/sodium antiporter [Myxococcota bacterium]|nr:calcium/sodium antiporter [Myxococcota bacterium]MBU1535384.1 calcium/sodium antiporter [Myxococcota bacterium]
MNSWLASLSLGGGLVCLILGANWLVAGGASIAFRMGISAAVVGLTVISYGTSLPEFTVSVTSSLSGSSELAFGNVLGSNIANIGLILGVTAMVNPIGVDRDLMRRDHPFLLLATALMIIFAANGYISRLEGGILLGMGISYTLFLILKKHDEVAREDVEKASLLKSWGLIGLGIGFLLVGGHLAVTGATVLAKAWGMSERVVGITVVSVGTSLPELAASLTASFKGESDMALGNIIGSNLFNILFVLGAVALIHPLSITFNSSSYIDVGVMGAFVLLLWPVMKSHHRIMRYEGVLFVTCYGGYLTWLVMR